MDLLWLSARELKHLTCNVQEKLLIIIYQFHLWKNIVFSAHLLPTTQDSLSQ